jgi:hypothetical protein
MNNLQEVASWVNEIVDNAIKTEKNNNRSVVVLLTKDKRKRR